MTDSILTYLDGYCERAGSAALWGEPLNALTNLFFILAAVLAARALVRHNPVGEKRDLYLLIVALFGIGIGSSAWHLHPTGATVLMDVIPITLFMNVYLIAALRRLVGLNWRRTLCSWGLYVLLTLAGQMYLPPDLFHGTVMYLPTYAAMVALTFAITRRDRGLGRHFAFVTTVWSASLIFRTVDMEICPQFPLGTHFLWHTLNAWVLWRLLMLMLAKLRTA